MKNKEPLSPWMRVVALAIALALPIGHGPATLSAATFYWDTDASVAGNGVDGSGLGGSGPWDLASSNWWNLTSLVTWTNTSSDQAIFTGPATTLPLLNTVTVSAGTVANKVSFLRSGYTLAGGDLTLGGTAPELQANLGESATIDSLILGTGGLTMTGGGSIRLTNAANSYTGATTISGGTLIVSNEAALGADSSALVVSGFNPVAGQTALRGFGGGSLVLDGSSASANLTRDLSLQGSGPIADRGAALISLGNNNLAGVVTMGTAFSGTNLSTRLISAQGILYLTSTLNILGTATTTIDSLGGVNQAGASFFSLTGVLAGTGTLESSGGGTLFLNPFDATGFSGTVRVSGSAASGQNVVRIDSENVLGTRTATTTSSVLDMNGGVLAVLMDSPSVLAGGAPANVYGRANSTFFADHTPNSDVKDQTVTFGQLAFEENITLTFNSRNGYGMTFSAAPVQGGNNVSTFANNLQGGGLLTFTGNFWSNSDNTASRTLTFSGNGNTLISGNLIAAAAAFDHNITKSGTGTLTISSTGSTLDGAVNIQNGTLAIADFRSIANNTANINIGSTTTSATLAIVGSNVAPANLTTSKVIDLTGTTGGVTILANQTGTSPGVILNADFTGSGGTAANAKTLTLGGANTGQNTINGIVPNNAVGGLVNLTKIDSGTWVLAGENTFTGATTIANGILKLKANDASSTIVADTSGIAFNAVNTYAGGTLEFVGQPGVANVEVLGALTPTNGSGTIKLTPGSGGTASLVFASLGTVGGGGTVNIQAPTSSDTISVTSTAIVSNIANAGLFYNGSDFAFVPGAATALRAPDYTTDGDFVTSATALTAARSMEITGSFSNAAVTIDSLRISGAQALDMTGLLTIRTAGTSNASGGIILTGGSGSISGTGVSTGGSGVLVINVDGGANTLTLNAPITSTTTGGFTKVGAGTLVLAGTNVQTGTISINEGMVQLSGTGSLGAAAALTIRQDATLDLNGVTPATSTNAFNNNGVVTNSNASAVTFTIGGANGTGTSFGIIEDGSGGAVSVIKLGIGAQTWSGRSTYTGVTTIGSTGIVTVNDVANGTFASGFGAATSDAGNLVFNGASATQAYGGLSFAGTTNDFTDHLFTFDGVASGGARIQANGVNGATLSFTNPGALAFGSNATGNPQGLVLGGTSTGDNRFSPIVNDNGAAATSVYKMDAGVWYLEATNGYSGATTIVAGTLYANDGTSLPTASNLVFNGASGGGGSLAATGAFARTIGTGPGQIQWTANSAGGFSAGGAPLTVDLGSNPVWGSTPGFLGTGALLFNNSGVAKSDVTMLNGFEITVGLATTGTLKATTTAASATVTLTAGTTAGLAIGQTISGNSKIPAGYTIATITGATTFTLNSATGVLAGTSVATNTLAGGYRQVNVGDFTSIGADFASISGVISGAGSLAKEGAGILNLLGANTYTGLTLVRQGTLTVKSLGDSGSPGATSVGDSTLGNSNARAIALGNGTTTGGILEYIGLGETSDRKIRLNTTTGANQIHSDGVGALILTNVANDMTAGAKTLSLRGVNAAGNMITSQLSDNGGALSITVDGSAMWILTNAANNYSGTTTVGAGALGIGDNAALGGSTLALSNGSVFAYGADRTISNALQQVNNTGVAFIGDYSLNFTNTLAVLAGANNPSSITNNIANGKTLTFADVTANAITAARTWTFDGGGETVIAGNITTSTAFNFSITKTGLGTLTLGGAASDLNAGVITVSNGTLKIAANNVLNNALTTDLVINPAATLTATLDLNGRTDVIRGLTANSAGTAVIDNSAATSASLTFGNGDQTVTMIGNTTNTGAGALSLTKTGTALASFSGGTYAHKGATSVNGGSLVFGGDVSSTSSLSVTGVGSDLRINGGFSGSTAVASLEVSAGSSLFLSFDNAGTPLTSLISLSLGNTGIGTATLRLNIGDITTGDNANSDTITLLTGGTLSLGNTITFNMSDSGINPGQTYTLLHVVDGGLSAFGFANLIQGTTPGGFSSYTWTTTDTLVQLSVGASITGSSYWRGKTDATWNGAFDNWSTDKAGAIAASTVPGSGTDVIFQWDAPTNAAVSTTLEQNFKINSLTFEASSIPANTPTSVTIAPGALPTNRLQVAPQVATDGVKIASGGPATVTISTPFKVGADQTWSVADATSTLTFSGALMGEQDVTVSGAGKIVLGAAADATFNPGLTSDFTITGGTLEIQNAGALGTTVAANAANVSLSGGTGAFYYNGAAATVNNPLTLGGGTLSAGTANQIYSGTVNVSANSSINMRDSNSANLATTARNITLSGVLGGTGRLTVDSINTLSAGNQLSGTLTLSNDNSGWSGGLEMVRGTVTATNVDALGSGAIAGSGAGRIIFNTAGGTTFNLAQNIALDAPGGVLELSADASGTPVSDMTVNLGGVITIGSAANSNNALRVSQASDNFSVFTITNSVVLGNDASLTYQGSAVRPLIISGVISDGGSGYSLAVNDELGLWAVTSRTVRLTGLNTFSGNISIGEGTLEFDTVTNIAGGPSSLGQGSAISMGPSASTLSFIGSSSQSTDRPITTVTGAATFSANGTAGATITYSGAISVGPTADGSQVVLTGTAGSEGILSGGITMTGDLADITVNGGTWSHVGGVSRIGDDATVTGATTILNLNGGVFQVRDDFTVTAGATLNLNATGVLTYNIATLSADSTLRATAGGTISFGANDSVDPVQFDGLRIGVDAAGLGTLNMNNFNQTVTEFILGNRDLDREGLVNGSGTLTVTGNLDLYEGTIYANLASTGSTAFEKFGSETVTLAGDNSGLASTAASIVYEGTLVLDYSASNTTKFRTASALDMRGADLVLVGNAGAPTSQSVASFTLGTGGSSQIALQPAGGQNILLALGAITRANLAQDGTLRLILPAGVQSVTYGITTTTPNSNFGLLGTGTTAANVAGYATVDDGTGVWFATSSSGNIVALASTVKNAVTTWAIGDHVTDDATGFTGTLGCASINSLRFDAVAGSDVNLVQGSLLNIGSGGILVTGNVGGTPSIMGGILASGVQELVVTQDSAQTFAIGSDIRINHALTKSGAGVLLLSGNNVFTGYTEIQEGTLQVGGGNAIGDNSLVTLSASRNSTLALLADETIGRLQGGLRGNGSDYGIVDVDANTLRINQSSNTTYAGFFTGTGGIVLNSGSAGNLNLTNLSAGFTGVFTVDGGLLQLSGIGQINASIIRVNQGAVLLIDDNGTTRSGTRIVDTSAITLNSADGGFGGQTIVRGLAIRTDQDATLDETVGVVTAASGASYVAMEATTANDDSDIVMTDLVRLNNATLNVRGTNLGSTNANNNQFRIGDAANQTAFVGTLVGGGGAAGTKNINILPWAIGESTPGATALAAANMGNSLVTYVSGAGFRPLDFATEYNTIALAGATDNARESRSANLTGLSGTTVNSLVLNNIATTALTVSGTGAGQTLVVTSGAILFTVTGAATNTAYSTNLGGFNNGITVGGTNEYVFHVVNPNSSNALAGGATTIGSTNVTVTSTTGLLAGMTVAGAGIPTDAKVLSVTDATHFILTAPATLSASTQTYQYSTLESLAAKISSPLTSAADITKSGRGTLVLSGVNSAGGGSNKTTINEGTLEIGDLDAIGGNTGGLVFAGGTLRFGAGLTDDISLRAVSFLLSGAILDSNGVDLALANSVGSGLGGLTKIGSGNLTLNAAATYGGATTVAAGTLTIGADNATGVGGDLTIGAGATLDIGTKNITAGLVSTIGADPVISGTGIINAATGFLFNNTAAGGTSVSAILAGSGGLLKAQTNGLTLSGANTYTGVTEVQAGAVTFDTISNVGGGASALGAPATVENGIIHTGLGGTSAILTYTGSGSTTNRIVAMQGTTGGLTINGNGSGALILGSVQTETAGTKTLTLSGTSLASASNSLGLIDECVNTLNVSKTGANTWVLTGANIYTGTTSAGGGTLRAANDLAFGTVSSVILINTDAILELADAIGISNALGISNTGNNKTLQLQSGATSGIYSGAITIGETTAGNFDLGADTGGTLDVSGAIGGAVAGGVTKVGLGTVILSGATANTYTGVTSIDAGILDLNKTAGVNAIVGDGATSKVTADVLIDGGTLRLLANDQLDNSVFIDMTAGAFKMNGKSDTIFEFTNSGGAYTSSRGSALTVTDPIWSGGTNDVFGNDVYGNLEISGGVNTIHGDEATTLGAASVTVGAGGLLFSGTASPVLVVSSDNGAQANAGRLVLGGDVGFTGADGTASILNGVALQPDGVTPVDGNVGAFAGTVDLGGVVRTFTIADGAASADMIISARIDNGGLIKAGAGTLQLAGPNSYTGATLVNGGVLEVAGTTGSSAATGTTVSINGTLAGTGTISGTAATHTIDGTVSPGANGGGGLGALNFQGNLAFNANSIALLEIGDPNQAYDKIKSTGSGTLTLNSSLNIDVTGFAAGYVPQSTDIWTLLDWATINANGFDAGLDGRAGGLGGGTLNLPNVSSFSLTWNITQFTSLGQVSFYVVPEPGRAMLMFFGLAAFFLRRRRCS